MNCVCKGQLERCYLCGRDGKPQPSQSAELPPMMINLGEWHQKACWIQVETLRMILAAHGLAIVPANQPCSGCEELKVKLEQARTELECFCEFGNHDYMLRALEALR